MKRIPLFLALVVLPACSGAVEDTSDGAQAETTQCRADVQSQTQSTPQNAGDGRLVSTTFDVTSTACVASTDAPGVIVKMEALARDDDKLSHLAGKKGAVFSSYNVRSRSGDPASAEGETRLVDVSFRAAPAKTTLQINVKKVGDQLSLRVVNTKGISAFFITPVEAGGLDVRLTSKPITGGAGITGTAKAIVKPGFEDKLSHLNELPALFIEWLKTELANE